MTVFPIKKQFWLIPLLWLVLNAVADFRYATSEGVNFNNAIIISAISNLILAAFCTGAAISVRFYRPRPEQSIYLISGILVSAFLWNWLCGQIINEIPEFTDGANDYLTKATYTRLLTGILMISIFTLAGWISYFINEQLEEKSRHQEIENSAKEAELNNLRQQLQPHFLFNTLNSISALSGSNPEMAKKMILQLSDFLRGTIRQSDEKTNTLDEELTHLNLYLEIEKIRFGNRLSTEILIEKNTGLLKLPALILQPLVENAIKFGLYDTIDEVKIDIKATKDNNYLIIRVENPYDEATTRKIPGTGFGLNSVSRRLYLLFGRNDLLETTAEKGKFTVVLKIPISR